MFGQAALTAAAHASPETQKIDKALQNPNQPAASSIPHTSQSLARPAQHLPRLPPRVPLPPQEELTHFDTALQSAIEDLQPPSPQGLDVALTVLEHMVHISDLASCIATSWPEFYALLLHATKLVVSVLSAREVGARNVLVRSLAGLTRCWDGREKKSMVEIAALAGQVFDSAVQERRMVTLRLGMKFAVWLIREHGRFWAKGGRDIRILTLGVSRAVLTGLQHALAEDADLEIRLEILTALDQGLPAPPSYERLHVTVCPTSAIGTASQGVDVLLVEPSCIGPTGNLVCQNGSLGAAVCVKALSPSARVVALSSGDSIAISVAEKLTAGRGNFDETPEWVPWQFVDFCTAESGVLNIKELRRLAEEAEQLDRQILRDDSA